MELMNIEKKQSPSFIHPSHPIHPSFMVQWWVLLIIFGQKTLVFINTPLLLFFKKFENSSCRVKGWYGW